MSESGPSELLVIPQQFIFGTEKLDTQSTVQPNRQYRILLSFTFLFIGRTGSVAYNIVIFCLLIART